MSTRTLKWIAVIVPVLFMVGVLYVRLSFTGGDPFQANLYAFLAVALGAIAFSIMFFAVIERREAEVTQSNRNLEALHQAALALTTEVDLQLVLQKVVDLSRELLHAKYGALGVADLETNRIRQFITAGIGEEERLRIGPPPQGHGLLGVLNPGGQTLIVNDIRKDPRSIGFPPNHPPMKSLLGVPIKSKGEIFGNLYVADRYLTRPDGGDELLNFDMDDCGLLEKFATQAAIAIENAQLYRQTQDLAVVRERERFGMALHDGIMQQVYATGLSLQEAQHQLPMDKDAAGTRVGEAIESLGQIMRDLRNYILGLRTGRYQGQDLASSLAQMTRELRANTLMNVNFNAPSRATALGLTEAQTDELVLAAQEALTNIRKHAYARNVNVDLERQGDQVNLSIVDDGLGFDPAQASSGQGNGLRNLRERAQTLGAKIEIASQKGKGTRLLLAVPVKPVATNLAGA
jgi:signal transduction histidine kinase